MQKEEETKEGKGSQPEKSDDVDRRREEERIEGLKALAILDSCVQFRS